MRIIKFRGKALYDNKWVFGSLRIRDGIDHYMIENGKGLGFDVYKETVGQFTGVKDMGGEDIYDGDLIQYNEQLYKIEWDEDDGQWEMNGVVIAEIEPLYWNYKDCEIIANIHDNPKLTK